MAKSNKHPPTARGQQGIRNRRSGGWQTGQLGRGGKRKQKSRFKLTYNTPASKEKQPKEGRLAQGELPAYKIINGDTSTLFGHTVQTIDNRSTFRALFQNPNGVNPHPGNYQFAMSLLECHDNCISLIGLAETNREWNNFDQLTQLREATHKIWRASVIQTSTSSERFEENYKPGGTATILCEDHWVCRILEKGEDPWGLGRWSYLLLSGKKNRRVLSVNGYRVCQSTAASSGATTAYKQQYNILRVRQTGTVDPRRQYVLDIQVWLAYFIAQGIEVIFYLDGNENLRDKIGKWCELPPLDVSKHVTSAEHDGSLASLVTTLGLLDVLQEQHREAIPSTYSRGTRRLDYVFVTPNILPSVQRSCMLPFHTVFGGDHRPILIDFDARSLFGDDSYEVHRPQSRGLTLKDPRIVDKYLDILQTQLTYHKIYDKYEALQDASDRGGWSDYCVTQYEKMDNIITESTIHADRQVAKRYSSRYEWSPELIRTVNAVRYWELRLKQAKGIAVDSDTVATLREAAKLPMVLSDHIVLRMEIVECLRAAKREMYDSQKRHVELRQSYMEELAEAVLLQRRPWLAEEGREQTKEEAKSKQLKELIKRENLRKMHRTIGYLLKPGQGRGLLQVDIPDTDAIPPPGGSFGDPEEPKYWRGPWISIKDPEEMAAKVAQANIKSYHQAHPTPFCGEPLGQALGKNADSPIADLILSGKPIPASLTATLMDETKRMIHELGKPPNLVVRKEIKLYITMEEYKAMYKKLDESLSSSPSTKHVGHYKAATRSDALSRLYAGMMSLPYVEGFSPARWQVSMDVMLPKEENNWRISRLRIIQLYESDANQSMRQIFARQLGFILEDSNLVPAMQFGSRPGKMCISPVLQKVLTFDIARMAKLVLASQELDAIGCYDRIANRLGYLMCRRLGLPHTAIKSLAETWANMVHVIRTAYGRSTSEYRSTAQVPLYGAGQGSTNGPFFWLLMFIILYDSLDPEMRTLVFVCAWATLFASRPGDSFVDDSHLGVTSSYVDDPELSIEDNGRSHELQVLDDLTKLAQHYERLLWSTGGALNILKCSWVLISWTWKNGRASLATIEQAPGQIELTAGTDSTKKTVPRLQPTASYRTLGVYISGDGSQRKAKELLRGHSATYAGKIGPAHINSVTAFYAFQLYLGPKLGYPLPVSSFTFKECSYIQAPALMVTLPKLKINRNTARSIVHGPYGYGGLRLQHLYCEQANGQLRLLLGHLRNRDHTGELIIIAMSYLQILVGSTKSFWNLPYPKYAKWLENSWIKSIWAFLHCTGFTLDVRLAWTPPLQRDGDSTLMSIFIESGYSGADLAQLNRCRLFHQVFFVSDIASANGKGIDGVYRSREVNGDRRSTWQWPKQGLPDSSAWRLWSRALQYLETNGRLRVPLGAWIAPSHQHWSWQIHISTQTVVRFCNGTRTTYSPMTIGRTRSAATLYSLDNASAGTSELRDEDEWAAVTPCFSEVGDGLFSIQYSGVFLKPVVSAEPPVESSTFQDKLLRAHPFFLRLIGPIEPLTDGTLEAIRQYLEEGSLLTCSDGSHDPEGDTACQAWIFSDSHGHILWSGAGPIDGHPDMVTAYRSELGGITTVLFLLVQLVEFFGINKGSVTLFCDNSGALDNVFDEFPKRGIYPLLQRDYDLLGEARSLLRRLPIRVTKEWVKGHYKGDQRELKHNLNDLADYMATQFQRSPPEGFSCRRMPLLHPEYEAILYHSGSAVTMKFKDIIYAQVFSGDLASNIQKRTGWTQRQFDCISWQAYEAAFRAQTLFRRISIAKLSHDLWNTGAQKKLFGQDEHGLCPVCGVALETMDHVFQCDGSGAVVLKQTILTTLEDDLNRIGTPRSIRVSFVAGLKWWMLQGGLGACPKAPGFGSLVPSEVWATNAYAEQTSLGWGQVLRGRISKLWGDAYVRETHSGSPKELHQKWSKQVILLLWKIALSLWDHRNGALHGITFAQQQAKAQEDLHRKLRDLYALHEDGVALVHSSAQYLFDTPLEVMLKKVRQYLLCWVRSVEAAITYQEQEASVLRHQASRHFAPRATRGPCAPVTGLTRIINLRDVDITSPGSYNLRQRRRGTLALHSLDSEDSIIPPAMFDEGIDSSYIYSDQQDVGFLADSSIATNEIAQLASDLDTLSFDTSASLLDSDYSGSRGTDVIFRPDATISSAELAALGSTSSSSHSSIVLRRAGTTSSIAASSLSPGEIALLRQLDAPSILASFSSDASLEPVRWLRTAGLPPIAEHHSTPHLSPSASLESSGPGDTVSTLGSNDGRIPFPLSYIGALYEEAPSPATSPLGLWHITEADAAPRLTVYGEHVPAGVSEFDIPLRQPSVSDNSMASGSTVSGGIHSARPLEDHHVLALVRRAQHWLFTYQPSNREVPLSPSIYWAIRSLPTFYAVEIMRAEQAGATSLLDIGEDEWPPPATEDETYECSGVPAWLRLLVNLENLHAWGRHGVRYREADLRGPTTAERWLLLRDLYVEDIPQRELDDPPDLGEIAYTGSSQSGGIIEELTSNEDQPCGSK